jgi:HEAT repeat protein
MLGVQIAVMVSTALASANAGDAAGVAAPLTFAKKAEFATGAPALFMMEWRITPGLECLTHLESEVPWFKDFPGELANALDSADAPSRAAALLYLARLATLVRHAAWQRDRDDGDDLFAVALGQHARSIGSGLAKALQNTQGKDRLLAAVSLMALTADHRAALDTLLGEMRADATDRRRDACEWVGNARLAHPQLITALAAAIADTDDAVRSRAVLAVWHIGPKAAKAAPALMEWLKKGEAITVNDSLTMPLMTRARLKEVLPPLAEMGVDAKAAVAVFVERLRNGKAEDRLGWFAFLAQFGPKARDVVGTLRSYLASDDDDERFAAAATILCVDLEDREAAGVLVEGVRTQNSKAIRACAEITPKVKALVPPLIETLKHPAAKAYEDAAEALGNMGPLAESAIPRLAALVIDGRYDARIQSVAALALAGIGKASIPALTKIVAKPYLVVGRATAAFVLGSLRDEAAVVVPALMRALDDANPAVRMNAAAALGRLGKAAAPARAALTRASQRANTENVLFAMYDHVERVLASWALTQVDR